MKKLVLSIILSISIALFGCSENVKEQDNITTVEEVELSSVSLSITIPEEVEGFDPIEPMEIEFSEGETIIDVTEKSGIELDVNGTGENAYVEGINGLGAFDEGSASGWLVKVNGEFINVGPGAYEVEENDEIEWLYTTDFNKEFE